MADGGLITPSERSRQIDNYLKDEAKKYKKYMRKTMRLLLTGAGESGKSTIVKQMKILHKGGYTDSERLEFVPIIRSNLRDAILTITGQMHILDPPVDLSNEDLKPAVDYMLDEASVKDFAYTNKFYDHATALWEDEGVQECYARSHEYQLIDSAAYFLDRIEEVRESDYKPSNQDILRSRVMTTGVLETKFEIHMQRSSVNFHLLDVGGQREERKKWVQCFSDVTALIFVTACSGYDTYLREAQKVNRLVESLQLYEDLWNNRFLKDKSFILFLNKQDILAEKVAGGRSKIGTYFPAFKDYIAGASQLDYTRDDDNKIMDVYVTNTKVKKVSKANNANDNSDEPKLQNDINSNNDDKKSTVSDQTDTSEERILEDDPKNNIRSLSPNPSKELSEECTDYNPDQPKSMKDIEDGNHGNSDNEKTKPIVSVPKTTEEQHRNQDDKKGDIGTSNTTKELQENPHQPKLNKDNEDETIGDVETGCLCCFSMKKHKADHVRRESTHPQLDGLSSTEFYKVKSFIKDMFQKLSTTDGLNDAFKRRMYPHYTCAIDTEKIRKVFEDYTIDDVQQGCLSCFFVKTRKLEPKSSEPMDPQLFKVASFIKDMFKTLSTTEDMNDAFKRRMYPHYTCAVDTEKIRKVFEDCKDMIVRLYLNNTGVV